MKAFIFDLDGTLVDTKEDMMDAGNLAFQQLEWQVRLEGFNGLHVAVQHSLLNFSTWSGLLVWEGERAASMMPWLEERERP